MTNKLSLNVAKTEFQIIASKQMLNKTFDSQEKIVLKTNQLKEFFNAKH